MITKTISGHYDTVFSLDHNNRLFTPSNVDVNRSKFNYNCVAAGQLAPLDLDNPANLSEFWNNYHELTKLYWEDRAIARRRAYEEYQDQLEYMRRYRYACRLLTDDGISAIISLLFLPMMIPCGIYEGYQMEKTREEYEKLKEEQWIRDMEFKAAKLSFREAIAEQDRLAGTEYLQLMDSVVREMAQKANDYVALAKSIPTNESAPVRYATLEEIYDRLFEPAFREFQNKQRPCRRYSGTYLESIREAHSRESREKQQSKNVKSRKTAEAIEIVFCVGDMDNTGYADALADARRAEVLLKDFCDHLLADPHMCCVTTKELEDPNWKPPFKHGLIILNLNVHCDEATPGVHLTCIPYSRGCKRGPSVQAALGRAMTGMGYPSTWIDVLDEDGQRVPKRNKDEEIVYNKDGTIRYQQKPDKQGIIDWIEEYKLWIQKEMAERYGWTREYKGSHPRGNRSTPDYKVARARERKEELDKAAREEIKNYVERVRDLSIELHSSVTGMLRDASALEQVAYYLQHCPDEDYSRLMNEVRTYWHQFAAKEENRTMERLKERLEKARKRTASEKVPGRNGNRHIEM